MRFYPILCLLFICLTLPAAPKRFVVDDDEYLDKITASCSTLLAKGKLKSQTALREEIRDKGHALTFAPASSSRLNPPEICNRLQESVVAVGSYYRCPDCNQWHFNSSSGFVVASNGVVATSCHVVNVIDEGVKESYLAAADSTGRVYRVDSVLAADTDADTCFLKVDGLHLRPLPMRTDIRAGERIYCLSNPGGNHFMFTEGMVARVNRRRDELPDDRNTNKSVLTRPILFLNITAEYAPGSSGAPIVDEEANVVGQVSSIAELGEPSTGDDTNAPSPSVAIRFCVASEEMLRLANPRLKAEPRTPAPPPIAHHPSHSSTNQTIKVPVNKP
jgi:serine protease Do